MKVKVEDANFNEKLQIDVLSDHRDDSVVETQLPRNNHDGCQYIFNSAGKKKIMFRSIKIVSIDAPWEAKSGRHNVRALDCCIGWNDDEKGDHPSLPILQKAAEQT